MTSPLKQPPINEHLLELVRNALANKQMPLLAQPQQPIPTQQSLPNPLTIPQVPVIVQTSPSNDSDMALKASPSASSDMSSSQDNDDHSMMMMQQQLQQMNNQMGGGGGFQNPLQQLTIDSSANIANGALSAEQRSCGRHETWLECFTTTKHQEYEALLFSVYVVERNERKYDGWTYFDCLHRLQSKCRYRVRAKRQDEFYIVEEKGVHNHGAVEPVGQAGSHAGLPKTIREIVDRSYNENWTLEDRTCKVDEEIQRLGLPANPRLGRQIDNRVAYLRRVKNLNESRRITDHVNGMSSPFTDPSALKAAIMDPQMLQALMDQNGGSLTVEKGMVEKLLGPQTIAELVSKQEDPAPPPPVAPPPQMEMAKPMAVAPSQEFLQQILQQQAQEPNHAALLAMAQQQLMNASAGQENISQ
ncbi:hypothetical protein CAEBREN_31427 [Caenorhabditis brenneri]|uniref:FLYWCH-type domain-containing protein n=1 Tax=Caenorhabditis brenneri TaxID=135651 RepID=G0PA94_CAEBE|nr:hypothetical protein CAEBREN_31427 [Caenorhabditis brenneri]